MVDNANKQIEIFQWYEGDWVEVFSGSKPVFQGHKVPSYEWISLLESLGARVEQYEMPEEFDESYLTVEEARSKCVNPPAI